MRFTRRQGPHLQPLVHHLVYQRSIQYSTVPYQQSTGQYSIVQYSADTVQYSTVQYSTVQYSTVPHTSASSERRFRKLHLQPQLLRPCF